MSSKLIQLKDSGSNNLFPYCACVIPIYKSMETEDLASVGQLIKDTFVDTSSYNRVLFIRVNSVTTGGGVFNKATFNIIAQLSSASYGWAILLSDNSTNNGVVFGRLSVSWVWKTPTMTTIS